MGCFIKQHFIRTFTAARRALVHRTVYLNEQWCLHGPCCFASQVRVQAATSLPIGPKVRVPERLGLLSFCLSAHPTAHGIFSISPPINCVLDLYIIASCLLLQAPAAEACAMLRFPSHSPEAEQSRERSHEAALAQWAEGFDTDNHLQSGGPEAVHYKDDGAPEASTRREEHTSTICLLKGPSACICSYVTITRGHTAHVMHYRWQLSALIVPTRKLI